MNILDARIVGTAIQLGLMAIDGHFDSSICCGVPMKPWYYAPDWAVTRIALSADRCYPLRVEGYNLNAAPGDYGHRFEWNVMRLDWRYRFELCESAGYAPS